MTSTTRKGAAFRPSKKSKLWAELFAEAASCEEVDLSDIPDQGIDATGAYLSWACCDFPGSGGFEFAIVALPSWSRSRGLGLRYQAEAWSTDGRGNCVESVYVPVSEAKAKALLRCARPAATLLAECPRSRAAACALVPEIAALFRALDEQAEILASSRTASAAAHPSPSI